MKSLSKEITLCRSLKVANLKKKMEAVQCFMHVNSWKQLVMEF